MQQTPLDPNATVLAVQHIILGFLNTVQVVLIGWLAYRRYLADKREKQNGEARRKHNSEEP